MNTCGTGIGRMGLLHLVFGIDNASLSKLKLKAKMPPIWQCLQCRRPNKNLILSN